VVFIKFKKEILQPSASGWQKGKLKKIGIPLIWNFPI
jgi:hypothetical protein